MKDSNSFVYNVWLIILLVAAYIWPIFGLVPAIYLFIKRKDEQLEKMQGWIALALIWQVVPVALVMFVHGAVSAALSG